MMENPRLSLLLVLTAIFALFLLSCQSIAASMTEVEALMEFKKHLKDPFHSMKNWKPDFERSPCDFSGVSCDSNSRVNVIVLEAKNLSGNISPSISFLANLEALFLPANAISGNIPLQLVNCTHLQLLNLSDNRLTGKIPNFGPLKSLEVLDLSKNNFFGPFPTWLGNLTGLTALGLGQNDYEGGQIPENIGKLKNLTWLFLAESNLEGEIPESVYTLKSLQVLDFSSNKLSGKISKAISRLQKLKQIELFSNSLSGEIPTELSELTNLRHFDMSKNQMSGKLPPGMGNLKKLEVFKVNENNLRGMLPTGFGYMRRLKWFAINQNSFSGNFPKNFGRFSPLDSIDISENKFSGQFPSFLCEKKKLQFLLALDNDFSGVLSESYGKCKSLIRLRVSKNRLSGQIPSDLWGLPFAMMIDFGDNEFSGLVSPEIGRSTGLNQLSIQDNKFSGQLPSELGLLTELDRLSASNNMFSGELPWNIRNMKLLSYLHLDGNLLTGLIPSELGECTRLTDLNLAKNSLGGEIPNTLSRLIDLKFLNLSQNRLSGSIPHTLQRLKLKKIDLSRNLLTGIIPSNLAKSGGGKAFSGNIGLCINQELEDEIKSGISVCSESHNHRNTFNHKFLLGIVIFILIALKLGIVLLSIKKLRLHQSHKEDDLKGVLKNDPSWKLEVFRPMELDANEICDLEENKLIGSGSTGKVYRLELKKSGVTVAVKQLWKGVEAKILRSEVEILNSLRHRNILKLHAFLTNGASSFLVLEYMEKGNLFQALRREIKTGKPELDWIRRHKIAVGAAKGIAYLHHDCSPAVIHRDIKSSNILLDEDYEPKIADFGIARIAEVSGNGLDLTCFAGTHGYFAPELAYSLKASKKSDVYSFGVVLLELVTGKSPFEPEFGDEKDIVYWISTNLSCYDDMLKVLDLKVSGMSEDDMIKVLKIAALCTNKLPSVRPTMREVLEMLIDADPNARTVPCNRDSV